MRYIIGVEMKAKDKYPMLKKQNCNGYYVYGKFGLASILTKGNKDNSLENLKIKVYDNVEDAQAAVSSLSKAYRRDDVAFSPSKKSKYIRKFYIVKLDSPKCFIKIDENKKEISRSGNIYYKIKSINYD